ncbi:MAG: hypothetical protein IAF08_13655 [Rhizobacter sp.]|nr:hypothetical protein [Chlorobiales bacterium]
MDSDNNFSAETISDAAGSVAEQLSTYYEQLLETPQFKSVQHATEQAVESVTDYVEKNPVQSVLISLGAGLIAGLILNRMED